MRNIHEYFLERSKKRVANQAVPTLPEWVAKQPKKWRPACAAFAANANAEGGVVGKTIDDIMATAKAQRIPISRRTLMRRLPDLERHKVVRQEKQFDWSTGSVRRKPSVWLLGLRQQMPDVVLPAVDESKDSETRYDARNEAWLRATGEWKHIEALRAREAAQPAEPPF